VAAAALAALLVVVALSVFLMSCLVIAAAIYLSARLMVQELRGRPWQRQKRSLHIPVTATAEPEPQAPQATLLVADATQLPLPTNDPLDIVVAALATAANVHEEPVAKPRKPRARTKTATPTLRKQLEAMSEDELFEFARQRKLRGFNQRWKRNSVIEKLTASEYDR
jgi:hypothetical protein